MLDLIYSGLSEDKLNDESHMSLGIYPLSRLDVGILALAMVAFNNESKIYYH